jgi:hypothetical protein
VPALPPYLIEPIFEQFCVLLNERKTNYALGCHSPHIPERVVFEKLVGGGRAKGRDSWLTVISGTFAQKPSKISDVSVMARGCYELD